MTNTMLVSTKLLGWYSYSYMSFSKRHVGRPARGPLTQRPAAAEDPDALPRCCK